MWGKKAAPHLGQNEINQLIIEKGDRRPEGGSAQRRRSFHLWPGRRRSAGAGQSGHPFEVVPGVTSAIRRAGYAGDPIDSQGLHGNGGFVTGTRTRAGNVQHRLGQIATGIGTLVFSWG